MLTSLSRRTAGRLILWRLGLYRPQTQTTSVERACLRRYATGRRRLVEIGVFNGVTTLEIRRVMAPDAVLWAVDPFVPGKLGFNTDELISKSNIRKCENGSVTFVKLTGAGAAQYYAQQGLPPVDFVFIDGDHSWDGISGDWMGWSPLVAAGAVIALHDSRSHRGREVMLDSARYTAEVICTDPRFEIVDEVESVTVLRRS